MAVFKIILFNASSRETPRKLTDVRPRCTLRKCWMSNMLKQSILDRLYNLRMFVYGIILDHWSPGHIFTFDRSRTRQMRRSYVTGQWRLQDIWYSVLHDFLSKVRKWILFNSSTIPFKWLWRILLDWNSKILCSVLAGRFL